MVSYENEKHSMKIPMKQTKICDNCNGNGYIRIDTVDGPKQVKQCWV